MLFATSSNKRNKVIFLRISIWEHEYSISGLHPPCFPGAGCWERKKKNLWWVNILSPLGQTPQLTAFLKPRRFPRSAAWARAFRAGGSMLLSFALACLEMRTICYTLLYCSISVDVVVVFVQESSGNKIYKGRQYRLIPSASCLWRQEDVTVAVFFLSAHVCMLQVVLQTPVVAQIYGWRLNLMITVILIIWQELKLLEFLGNCGHTAIKRYNPMTLPAIVFEDFLCLCVYTLPSHSQLSEVLYNNSSLVKHWW